MDVPVSRSPVADRSFRLLWAGEALALVAEQLLLVTLTLLVLDVAGPGAALGTVLAVAAVPRAVLLPFGGLLADRVSPAAIATGTTWVRAAIIVVLAALVAAGPPPLWAIASLAALLGALDAAYYPASLALLPGVVRKEQLPSANALVQGAESAGDLLGPAIAAGMVAAAGLSGALGAVGALYALAAIALTVLARRVSFAAPPPGEVSAPVFAAIREGLSFAWRDPVVRVILLVLIALNVVVIGPVLIGGAALVDERLGDPEQLGILFAAFGVGSLVGLAAAGGLRPRRRGLVFACALGLLGAGMAALGFAQSLLVACALAAVMGVGGGYLGVVLVAWLQERVPEELRGRVMSLVAFCAVALDPLSYAIAGFGLSAGITPLFVVAGGAVVACALLVVSQPAVRELR